MFNNEMLLMNTPDNAIEGELIVYSQGGEPNPYYVFIQEYISFHRR